MSTASRPSSIVRPAIAADAGGLTRLIDQLGYEASLEDVVFRLARIAQDFDQTVLVACIAEHRAGVAHVRIERPLLVAPFASLSALVVDRGVRGAGVGKTLVEAAERWARARQATRLSVLTNATRADACAFYARVGFEETRTSAHFEKRLG